MAFKLAEAFVGIVAQTGQLDKGLQTAKDKITNAVQGMQGILASLGVGVGVGALIGSFIRAAAAAEGINSKFKAVFKELTGEADTFAVDLASNIGRSVTDIKRAMGNFQDLFVPMGFARDEALKLSKQMTILGFDLASFQGDLGDDEAFKLLISGMGTSNEVFQRFGVQINEADIKQELLRMGINKTSKEVTKQEKALAKINLVMKGTADAQGNAAATSNEFTNRLKAIKGVLVDVAGVLGGPMLAPLGAVMSSVRDMLVVFQKMDEAMGGFASKTISATAAVTALTVSFIAARAAVIALGFSMRTALISTGVGALLVLAGALIIAFIEVTKWLFKVLNVQRAWAQAIEVIKAAWAPIKDSFVTALRSIGESFDSLLKSTFGDGWKQQLEKMTLALSVFVNDAIMGFARLVAQSSAFISTLVTHWDLVMDALTSLTDAAVLKIRDAFSIIPSAGRTAAISALLDDARKKFAFLSTEQQKLADEILKAAVAADKAAGDDGGAGGKGGAGAAGAAKKGTVPSGLFNLSGIQSAFQKALLKQADPQIKLVELSKKGNGILEAILAESKKTTDKAPATATK